MHKGNDSDIFKILRDDTPRKRGNLHSTHYYNVMLNMLNQFFFFHFCAHFVQIFLCFNPLKLNLKKTALMDT